MPQPKRWETVLQSQASLGGELLCTDVRIEALQLMCTLKHFEHVRSCAIMCDHVLGCRAASGPAPQPGAGPSDVANCLALPANAELEWQSVARLKGYQLCPLPGCCPSCPTHPSKSPWCPPHRPCSRVQSACWCP